MRRTKRDARLYFRYQDLGLKLGKLKTELIKLEYIEHVEGDKFMELKKLPGLDELAEILEIELNTGNVFKRIEKIKESLK